MSAETKSAREIATVIVEMWIYEFVFDGISDAELAWLVNAIARAIRAARKEGGKR